MIKFMNGLYKINNFHDMGFEDKNLKSKIKKN